MTTTSRSRIRSVGRSGATALIALTLLAPAVLGNGYAGWSAAYEKLGIKGYIKQPVSPGGNISTGFISSWIGVCAYDCLEQPYADGGSGYQWVQLGMYQGALGDVVSTSSVHIYYENEDPCGDYHNLDFGAPPSNPYRFAVWYPGGGTNLYHCGNGAPYPAYTFNFRKGATTTPVFAYGHMSTIDGRADANTERSGTPALPTSNFGCSTSSCGNTAYAIEVLQHNGVDWVNNWSAESRGPANPPYRHTFVNYWSFETCATQSACS